MTTRTGSTSSFYDLRGAKDLKSTDWAYGSTRLPLHVREPYVYVEGLLSQLRAEGATRLLDLCCGTGVHSIYPAKLGFSVTGVDISPESIKAAWHLAERNGVLDNCQFEVQEATTRLSMPHQFDVILISGSLYYLPLERTIELISQRLSPGGHLLCIETYGGNPIMKLFRVMRAVIKKDRDREAVSNLLGMKEIRILQRQFPGASLKLFDCTTLLGLPLGASRSLSYRYHRVGRRVDDFILNALHMRWLAFKFTIHAVRATPKLQVQHPDRRPGQQVTKAHTK